MSKQLSFIAATALILSCSSWLPDRSRLPGNISWLIGTWEQQTTRGKVYEQWLQDGDSTLSGKSFALKGKDTMVFESIRLRREGDDWFYIPQVKDQNGGQPVRFRATRLSATEMVFENPEHDFPQVITYRRNGKDALIAEVSGIAKGETRKVTFPMKKLMAE
ncbi:DUF6265 family protein [Taibaiella helva]|uniref:DUF6265 family protein n=1 Tax=Taibaiella helva TaxID=2301235 RepID=UPI000E5850FC|nr:DUF6265 family protein [Taibaiella helva]